MQGHVKTDLNPVDLIKTNSISIDSFDETNFEARFNRNGLLASNDRVYQIVVVDKHQKSLFSICPFPAPVQLDWI